MELASPGSLSEKLNINGKISPEDGIIQEHLKFDYDDTLNSDRLQDSEIDDTTSDEKSLTPIETKCLQNEKDYKQISLDPDPNDTSAIATLNENSSKTNGSFIESENSKSPSENHEPENENESEESFIDAISSKSSSEVSDGKTSVSHPNESLCKNSIDHYLDLPSNSSPMNSTDSLPALSNEIDETTEVESLKSKDAFNKNEFLHSSKIEKEQRDNQVNSSNEHLKKDSKIEENNPSQSDDSCSMLSPVDEDILKLTLPIVASPGTTNGKDRNVDVDDNEPELSNVHLKLDTVASTDQVSNNESNIENAIAEKSEKDPSSEPTLAPSSSSTEQPSSSVPPSNPRPVLSQSMPPVIPPTQKTYDYLLKVLLVGDSDVGKQEIISDMEDGTTDSPFCSSAGAGFKTTIILIDGKRVKLQLWDTSGQGRFCTIIRSYSRGAQGILLVYDITNKWSFEGINRWLKEVDQHAPGIPKVLVGNRLHLAFKRQVHQEEAEEYAERNSMGFFEVSPLVNFNISETLVELARMALRRNGMERWNGKSNKVSTLYELCAHSIVNRTTVYGIDRLKLPTSVKQNLKSYAVTNYSISQTNKKFLRRPGSSSQYYASGSFKNRQSGGSPASSICNSLRRVHRTRQHTPLANTPADAANVNCGPSRKSCTIS